MTRRPRIRTLSDEEIVLWRAVAETVDVRQPDSRLPLPPLVAEAPAGPDPGPKPAPMLQALPLPKPARTKPTPLADLDRRTRQRINRGHIGIERKIDLHGMDQGRAHVTLRGFLRQAHADDLRLVLVVTGKGERVRPREGEAGVLKRVVPHWLRELDLRSIVLGFEPAGIVHGGSGALYVRLRRRKAPA